MFAYFFFHENFSNSTKDTHLFLFLIQLHAIHPLVSRLLVKINISTFAFTFTSVFTGFDNVPTKFIYKINSKLKLKFSWIWTSQKIWSHTLPTKFISLWIFKHCSLLLIFTFWKGKLFRILCCQWKLTNTAYHDTHATIQYAYPGPSRSIYCNIVTPLIVASNRKFIQNWTFSLFYTFI